VKLELQPFRVIPPSIVYVQLTPSAGPLKLTVNGTQPDRISAENVAVGVG
jgi:hypothetical protein